MIMPYLLYMTKKYARAMLTLRGGMQWIHYGTPAVDDASRGARHGVPVEHASASATAGSTSRPGVQLEGPRLCQWLHSDVAFNRQSVVTRPLSMIPSLAVDHHPECGVPKDLDWIMDIWRRQRLLIDKCSSAIVASGIAGSDHRDWQPQALAMATTGTGTSQSIIQPVSDTTSTGSSCTPLSHIVQQCLSCQVVLDRMILSGGSVEVLMDIIQSALSGNTSGPSLCVDTGSEVSDSVSSIVTAGRTSESESFSRTLELLENGHRLHKRKLAAMLATYVGKYVLEALDIYHFMGRVDC